MLAQAYRPEAFEIILVDDGSHDGTGPWARSLHTPCQLRVIVRKPKGPASARNAGIEVACGRLLLFLDDDILCDGRLVAEHVAGHREAPGGLVHGRISLAPGGPNTLAARAACSWYAKRHSTIISEGGLHAARDIFLNANTSYPQSVIEDLGGFDEDIPFPREDFELGLRVSKLGVPIRYRPQARAYELVAKTSRALVRDARAIGAADVRICRKHPDYRLRTAIASSDPPPLASAAARAIFRRLPAGADSTLDPAVALVEPFIRRRKLRHLGDRLLAVQRQMAFDRAASGEVGTAAMLESEYCRWLPALLYHRVGSAVDGVHRDLTVSPDIFARQMHWLDQRGYTPISPTAWYEWCSGRGPLPRKPILITFDDAYADLPMHALPILCRHRFTATIFVVTRRLGGVSDWDPVHLPIMSAQEVHQWSRVGIEFGAHGRTHRDLSTLSQRDLHSEVVGSRKDLEQLVGRKVDAFAYPFGSQSEAARGVVSETFELGFLAEGGVNALTTPLHLLRRAEVGIHDSGPALEWRAWTGSAPLHALRDRLRIRSRLSPLAARLRAD